MQDFIKNIKKIQIYLNDRVFEVVGNEAVRHYKKSFRNEGFTDSKLTKWEKVKRRQKPRKTKRKDGSKPLAWDRAKILTQSGELGDSITFIIVNS
jgi:hypothetical protein